MAARLTRGAKSALAAFAVAIALVASAWLATASTPPQGGSYPGGTTTTTSTMSTTTTVKATTTTTHPTTTTTVHATTTSTSVASLGSSVPASTTSTTAAKGAVGVGDAAADPGSDSFAGLPFTGAQTLSLLMLAGCFVASGVVLVRGARHHRRRGA